MKKSYSLLLILLILCLTLSACSPYSNVHKGYIQEHTVDITLDLNSVLDTYETNFDSYDVFLIGEQHGISETFDIDVSMIKYLYETQNVRTVLLEMGFADGQLINKYMETGNEEYLKNIFANLPGTYAYSNNNYQMYRDLYAFNLALSADAKITFIGIDVQHQAETALYYMNLLLPEGSVPDSIIDAVAGLEACTTSANPTWQSIAQSLKQAVDNHEADIRSYFADEYDNFFLALEGVYQGTEFYDFSDRPDEYREEMMIQNFMTLHSRWNSRKAVALLGGAHVSLTSEDIGYTSFAEAINTSVHFSKNRVASIYLAYLGGKHMNNRDGSPQNVWISDLAKFLGKYIDYDLGFCRLDFDGTPFQNGYQYVITIKNAEPTIRYNIH